MLVINQRFALFFAVGVPLVAAVTGCASTGLSPRERPGRDVTAYLYATEAGLATDPFQFAPAGQTAPDAPATKVVKPAAIAVAQVGEVAPPDELIDQLRSRPGLFRSVSGVSGMMPPVGGGVERNHHGYPRDDSAVREHARHMLGVARNLGADYLLLYGGTIDASDRGSPLSVLDITIVGAFIVPSRVLSAEGRATAVIIDTRTGRVIATATGEDRRSTFAPAFGRDGAQDFQMRRMRDALVEELAGEIERRFGEL